MPVMSGLAQSELTGADARPSSGPRTDTAEKVLEKLATGDKATIVIERRTELKCELRQGLG
jgi:hypothetical protein